MTTLAVTPGSGDTLLTESMTDGTLGTGKIGLSKIVTGAAGTTNIVSTTNPMPVSLANTGANATAVKVDGSAVTQPVSGTVTATGTVAATQSGTWTVQPGNTANTTAWKVDGSAVTQPISGTVSITANSAVNVAQINGVTTTMGNGVSGTGVQRVTLASDSTGQVTIATGSATIGALTANQSVNTAQINGVTVTMGNGASGTGVQRVTIANDSTGLITTQGAAAQDAAISGNPVPVGNRASRAVPTQMSADGDAVYPWVNRSGGTVIDGISLTQTPLQVTASGDTSLIAAPGAGSRTIVYRVEASNSHASTALTVGLKIGAGSTFGKKYLPALGGLAVWNFSPNYIDVGDNVALNANLSGAGQVEYTVYSRTILT